MDDRWEQVDAYLGAFVVEDDALLAARTSRAVVAPGLEISPLVGRLWSLLVTLSRARRVLEFGTQAGYATIWLARAVGPSGRVVSLEADPGNAKAARANLEAARVSRWVDIWCGRPAEVAERMVQAGVETFDLVLLDAEGGDLPECLEPTMALTRPGALIVFDHVVRNGHILDLDSDDVDVRGVQRALAMIADDPRLEATAPQTVGAKGWDGIALVRRLG